mgnify:CR=1 FL=1|tara:strand:+ start:96 stop:443 length:348 start_codon:yes stop_codon:yes gene_type:complete
MEIKKVGYCYASLNKIKSILKDYNYSNSLFYSFNVVTNKGINFKLIAARNKIKNDFNKEIYFSIFGYNAAALKKFELHTNLTALSIREYNDIKGGAPYQVFEYSIKNEEVFKSEV